MSKVAIVKGKEPIDITIKALNLVEANKALIQGRPVLVKPNYIIAKHPSTGITTDSRVIEGVAMYLKHHSVDEVLIGEGSGHSDTFEAFRVAGVDAVADRLSVKMVDLNNDKFVLAHPSNPLALKRVRVSKIALESNIISVPKLKLHRITGVTLSMKNMMGATKPKGSLHLNLSKNIADLASVLKPIISVVDGIIGGEVHETSGNPVEMNLVIAGLDPVAVDAVGAAVMGVSPETVKHLHYAEQKGLGMCELNKIEIVGEPLEGVRRKFRRSISSRILSLLA